MIEIGNFWSTIWREKCINVFFSSLQLVDLESSPARVPARVKVTILFFGQLIRRAMNTNRNTPKSIKSTFSILFSLVVVFAMFFANVVPAFAQESAPTQIGTDLVVTAASPMPADMPAEYATAKVAEYTAATAAPVYFDLTQKDAYQTMKTTSTEGTIKFFDKAPANTKFQNAPAVVPAWCAIMKMIAGKIGISEAEFNAAAPDCAGLPAIPAAATLPAATATLPAATATAPVAFVTCDRPVATTTEANGQVWIKLNNGAKAKCTFNAPGYVTGWFGADTYIFSATAGKEIKDVVAFTFRPMSAGWTVWTYSDFMQFEIAYHGTGGANPACLRDAQNQDQALTPSCPDYVQK